MSYENAPSTILLATHCACCGRPLRDPESVEAGIGPDCRDKYGYTDQSVGADWTGAESALRAIGAWRPNGWLTDARLSASAIVHRVACGLAPRELAAHVSAVQALGFVKLAHTLATRATTLRVKTEGDVVLLWTPFSPTFNEHVRKVPGRRWSREEKVNRFPASSKPQLWEALRKSFAGSLLATPQGLVTIA